MPNLILTYRCNNNCEFCFSGARKQQTDMTQNCLKNMMPFILSFGQKNISLMGGEPSQHNNFIEILEFLLQYGLKVRIFSNGKMPFRLTKILQHMDGDFDFCINRSNPSLPQEIKSLYQKIGYRISLAITVFKTGQMKSHLFDEIKTYRLGNNYRLGIAFPVWPDHQNTYLHPKDYPAAADEIFEFIRQGIEYGLSPSFDCGFPYCFFSDAQKAFFKENHIEFTSHCGFIPDIGPDLSLIPCFPLAKFRISLSKNAQWDDITHQLNMKIANCSGKPIFVQCNTCKYLLSGKCRGGCAALQISLSETYA